MQQVESIAQNNTVSIIEIYVLCLLRVQINYRTVGYGNVSNKYGYLVQCIGSRSCSRLTYQNGYECWFEILESPIFLSYNIVL
jgi:hypothetical protein